MESSPLRSTSISIPRLRASLRGRLITPEDPGYDQARTVFYSGFDRRPAVIVRPAEAADVAHVASAGTWPEHTDGQHHELFLRAISEAWAWLVANGLLARRPGGGDTQKVFVTRAGREVADQPDGLARLQAEQRLGVELHPRLARKVATSSCSATPSLPCSPR